MTAIDEDLRAGPAHRAAPIRGIAPARMPRRPHQFSV